MFFQFYLSNWFDKLLQGEKKTIKSPSFPRCDYLPLSLPRYFIAFISLNANIV